MQVADSRIQQETHTCPTCPVRSRPAVTMVRGATVEPPVRLPRLRAGNMLLGGHTLPGRKSPPGCCCCCCCCCCWSCASDCSWLTADEGDWLTDWLTGGLRRELPLRQRAPGMQTDARYYEKPVDKSRMSKAESVQLNLLGCQVCETEYWHHLLTVPNNLCTHHREKSH